MNNKNKYRENMNEDENYRILQCAFLVLETFKEQFKSNYNNHKDYTPQ